MQKSLLLAEVARLATDRSKLLLIDCQQRKRDMEKSAEQRKSKANPA
jgi:hypothetical protein